MPRDLTLSLNRYALPAGLAYALIIVLGLSAEFFLRGPLIDWQSADATRIAISEHLVFFRLALTFDMIMAIADIFLAVFMFLILRQVNEALALLAMVFRLVQMVVITTGMMQLFHAETAALAGQTPLHALLAHAVSYDLGLLFFGVNTLLTSALLNKAGLVRPWLVTALALAGAVYIVGSVTRFVLPELNAALDLAYLIPVVAEISLCLWLLTAKRRVVHFA